MTTRCHSIREVKHAHTRLSVRAVGFRAVKFVWDKVVVLVFGFVDKLIKYSSTPAPDCCTEAASLKTLVWFGHAAGTLRYPFLVQKPEKRIP